MLKEMTTIAAIATPPGEGGIAVIRVSGPEAFIVCDRIFQGGKPLTERAGHTLAFGKIIHNGRMIDEVLASVMRAPLSYTGEDVVEISCHGGNYVTRSVLSAILENGAVLAGRGEFTKRAFLNGKLDLSQAEAVIDLIQAESEAAATLSVNQLQGKLSAPIEEMRKEILRLAAHLDAMADFPDEGVDDAPTDDIVNTLENLIFGLKQMAGQAEQGRLIRNGINTVIVGKPNVGKSSLLNLLSGTDRAIVTREAGTTRDVIEEQVRLGELKLNLFDTAGIRSNAEQIEEMGIKKAKEYIQKADLVFFVVDMSRDFETEDEEILRLIQNKKTIFVLNKADLESKAVLPAGVKQENSVILSAKTGIGMQELEKAVDEMFSLGVITQKQEAAVINMRHKQAVLEALSALEGALETLKLGMPTDLLSVDMRTALMALGTITGQTVSDEIVEEIFSRFCLGK